MKKKILLIIPVIFQLSIVNAQSLQGKWLMITDGATYSTPRVHIVEFSNSEMTQFEFDSIHFSSKYTLINDQIISNNTTFAKFKFLNQNRIRLFFNGKEKGKDTLFEFDFVRLHPTKSTASIEEIEQLEYKLDWNKENVLFKFNKELLQPTVIALSKVKNISEHMKIEKIDATLFVSIYRENERELSIPIKEVTKDYMIVYGVYNEIDDLKAFSIN